MKKFLPFCLLLFGILMFSKQVDAQFFSIPRWDYNYDLKAHERGQIHFFYGYGQPRLDSKLFKYHKNEEDYRVVGIGPFIFKTEVGLSRKLSVALSTTYINYKSDWIRRRPDPVYLDTLPFKYGTIAHDFSANLRFNYHFFVTKELDLYIGGGAGYNYFKHKDFTNYSPEDSTFNAQFKVPFPVSAEASIGARYFFLTRTAIYLEVGYGKSIAQAGFIFKFNYRKKE